MPKKSLLYTLPLAIVMLALPAISSAGIIFSIGIAPPPLPIYEQPEHRTRFIQFLGKDLARTASFQTVIFTSLRTDEVTRLRKEGVSVQTPVRSQKFLRYSNQQLAIRGSGVPYWCYWVLQRLIRAPFDHRIAGCHPHIPPQSCGYFA